MRTYDIDKVTAAVTQYAEEVVGFDPEQWLEDANNIALINENNDIALFEKQQDLRRTVCGHYFFFSRGKEAIKAARQFLEEIFSEAYLVETITGLTPENHKGALWMNKKLGFQEHGLVDTVIGPCRFVLLTKQQWKDSLR